MVRVLGVADVPALEAFLAARTETTMFLRSNLARAGIEYHGRTFEAVYVGAFDEGALTGVAAHCWNGNLLVAGGESAAALARCAVSASGRPVAGILGAFAEVVAARAGLDLEAAPTNYAAREILFDLALDALVLPEVVHCRPVADDELEAMVDWRMQFRAEAMGMHDPPEMRAVQRALVAGLHARGEHFVAIVDGAIVSYSAFNATLPDIVQIGGVYTPRALRGRGYARAAVGGSLRIARERGVRRAILFTGEENAAAIRCYSALGFRPIGDFGAVLFA
jgi:uncharacterized protein